MDTTTSSLIPYIPSNITVHLGPPGSSASNVTVSFSDYIKNVASSEIYPTWEQSALRANILAQVSFALNRVYTEYYRSRGYDFDITSSTATDQKFIQGRNIYENISELVDELFDDYIRRQGFLEPLSARFCNGTTVTCEGLSQWGSQSLAQQGLNSVEILRTYYGDNIELVLNARIEDIRPSYPGEALRRGDANTYVGVIQIMLNRVSQAYPAIPKISPVDGIFGQQTENAVTRFQEIFSLTPDGVVGKATWNKLLQLYVGILALSELVSEGQTIFSIDLPYPDAIEEGDSGEKVALLQYFLSVLSDFISEIPAPAQDGVYGPETRASVEAFQRYTGLPVTGVVGRTTWDEIYQAFVGTADSVLTDTAVFPETPTQQPSGNNVAQLQRKLNTVAKTMSAVAPVRLSGQFDRATQNALADFQSSSALPRTGRLDPSTKKALDTFIDSLKYEKTTRLTQYPGYELSLGMTDSQTGGSGTNGGAIAI